MLHRFTQGLRLGIAALALVPGTTFASSTVTWNTDETDPNSNVVEGPTVPDDETGASVIYQNPPANTDTNGQIIYTAPEANTPGLVVENGDFNAGGNAFDGCIRATGSVAACDSGFRTGKRFKQQITDNGAIDLVFDVEDDTADDGSTLLRSFHRLINVTGRAIQSFTVELGFGVGDAFTRSGDGDGLSFSDTVAFGPRGDSAFSQFPFGLFGDADDNPNFELDGFFDDARSGFDLDIGEDVLASDGYYGLYEQVFGDWLSQEDAPRGLLWDDDGDPATDALVMSWFDELSGQWETLRSIDTNGNAISILDDPQSFASPDDVLAFLEAQSGLTGIVLEEEENIEDLANLNLNYAILIEDSFFDTASSRDFTLRVTTEPVPVPPAAPLLAAGVGLMGLVRRWKAARA